MSAVDEITADSASVLDHPCVEIEAVDAAACGAFGCVRDAQLVRVRPPWRDQRTLCPEHAAEYLEECDVLEGA